MSEGRKWDGGMSMREGGRKGGREGERKGWRKEGGRERERWRGREREGGEGGRGKGGAPPTRPRADRHKSQTPLSPNLPSLLHKHTPTLAESLRVFVRVGGGGGSSSSRGGGPSPGRELCMALRSSTMIRLGWNCRPQPRRRTIRTARACSGCVRTGGGRQWRRLSAAPSKRRAAPGGAARGAASGCFAPQRSRRRCEASSHRRRAPPPGTRRRPRCPRRLPPRRCMPRSCWQPNQSTKERDSARRLNLAFIPRNFRFGTRDRDALP